MPEGSGMNITPEQLQQILAAVLKEAKSLNPLDQKKYDEEIRKEQRRLVRAALEGYSAELGRWNRQQGCTHCRYPAGTQNAGDMAPRGQGEWRTGGQVTGDGSITLICMQCGTTWQFKATRQEIEYANNAPHGLLGFPPPAIERCLNQEDFIRERPIEPTFQTCGDCGEQYSEKFGHKCSKSA